MADDSQRPIEVIVCDDHQIVAEGLAALLALQAGIEVVAVVGSLADVVAAASGLQPDVVLTDYDLPDGTGIEAIGRVLDVSPHTHVVMLTSFTDDAVLLGAIGAGATGFMTKQMTGADLGTAVRAAARGESVVAPELLTRLLPRLTGQAKGVSAVSAREREVLELLAEGISNNELAARLSLSPHTVRNHLARIYARLGARSRLEAVAIAVREGLVTRR